MEFHMIGQEIPKIKLSSCTDPQKALRLVAKSMQLAHEHKAQQFPQHGVFAVDDTHALNNALLFFVDGGAVDLLLKDPLEIDKEFIPSESLLNDLMDSLFENDLNAQDLAQLPPHHPFKILKDLQAIQAGILKA